MSIYINLVPAILLSTIACGSSSRTAPSVTKTEAGVNKEASVDAGPSNEGTHGEVADSMLAPLLLDLPKNISVEQCDELCLLQAVCFETVNGGDYQGGNRCVDDCEGWGNEAAVDTADCLRSSEDCREGLECF